MTKAERSSTVAVARRKGPTHARSHPRTGTSGPRTALRIAIALAFGIGVALLVWRHIGTHLSVTTDVVGSTTFSDLDVYRYIYRFYDVALVLPAAAAVAYVLLNRFGPLRSARPTRSWPPLLEETESVGAGATFDSTPSSARDLDHVDRTPARNVLWALARVALVALAVGIESNIATSPHESALTWFGFTVGCLYALAVAAVTATLWLGLPSTPSAETSTDRSNSRWSIRQSIWTHLATVNAFGAVVVIPLLGLVSSSTTVTVVSNGHVVHYPWFPAWFAVLATVLAVALLTRALLRSRTSAARRSVERSMLLIVVGPILLFLVTAGLNGAQGPFHAFDDAQAMVGAKLTFWHGLWPWRELYLLHGFLFDAFYGAVGMWVLAPTRWGSNSGLSLFVAPLTMVALYGFIVYFARKNPLLVVAGSLALVLGLLSAWPGTRFLLLPIVLILFDRVLRRPSWTRCLLFMFSVVFISIVTPEATLLMVGVLATLVVAEVVHRARREPLWKGFQRTLRCAAMGVALVAVWVVFLVVTGTFSGFVDYYLTAATGHQFAGALTPQWTLTGNLWATTEFALPIALFLLTVWKVVAKLVQRAPWRPIEWVLVASSTPVLLFYQLALDRMDYGHVVEVFQTLVPFVLLWAMEIVRFADSVVVRAWDWFMQRWSRFPRVRLAVPVTVLGLVAIAAGSPSSLSTWKNIPSAFHAVVPVKAPTALPLGYTQPGAVDVSQITDLGKVLDRYAGKNEPVFDFANEIGITYFLLDRVPGARFYHVESAQTARAQNLEVDDLKKSRPPVVIFNDTTFGFPDYDGIWSMERNYIVSQYILDHYRPLLDTHGQLVMLRDDLMKDAHPLPRLSQPPLTKELYFDLNMPACNWGDVPNFLTHPSSDAGRRGLALPMHPAGTVEVVSVVGWAFDTVDHQPTARILAVSGGHVVGEFVPNRVRTDVAAVLHTPAAANSGFEGQFEVPVGQAYTLYALNRDGSVTPLAVPPPGSTAVSPLPPGVTMPDGSFHRVRPATREGQVDAVTQVAWKAFRLTVPPGTNLSSYRWLYMQSPHAFGNARFQVTDSLVGGGTHVIAWNTLPRAGNQVFTRVGSCLQWHGYRAPTLTVLARGAPGDFSVRLVK